MSLNDPSYAQKITPAFQLGKKRARLYLPAFSVNCGEQTKQCLSIIDSVQGSVGGIITSFTTRTSKFTVDCWVKPGGFYGASEMALFGSYLGSNKYGFRLWLDTDYKLNGSLRHDASTNTTVKHPTRVNYDQWNHVGIAWDGTLSAPNTWSLWVNGVEAQTVLASETLSPLYDTTFQKHIVGPNYGVDIPSGAFKLDELRVWNFRQTQSYFQRYRNARRAPSHSYGTDSGCVAYYKFNETLTPSSSQHCDSQYDVYPFPDDIDGLASIDAYKVTYATEGYPYSLGMSFIVAEVSCASLGRNFSFKYPIKSLPGADGYSLAVSWTDRHGVFQRRFLYKTSSLTTTEDTTLYAGERVEYASAVLEFWNDLYSTQITQSQDLYIDFSYLSSPKSYSDATQPNLSPNPSLTTSIYAPFPLVFPITFNQANPW